MGKRLTIALAVFALVAVPLAIYVTGYFALGERSEWLVISSAGALTQAKGVPPELIRRTYSQQWMKTAFQPTAKIEAWLRGVRVEATWATYEDSYRRFP